MNRNTNENVHEYICEGGTYDQIGRWAQQNFGHNRSAFVHDLQLNSLAPLMGLIEELGEMSEAQTFAESDDAIGDFGIYLSDYCCRESINRDEIRLALIDPDPPITYPLMVLGRLFHHTLKYHQGIRHYKIYDIHNRGALTELYHSNITTLVKKLFQALVRMHPSAIYLINQTWKKVVAKRAWNANRD